MSKSVVVVKHSIFWVLAIITAVLGMIGQSMYGIAITSSAEGRLYIQLLMGIAGAVICIDVLYGTKIFMNTNKIYIKNKNILGVLKRESFSFKWSEIDLVYNIIPRLLLFRIVIISARGGRRTAISTFHSNHKKAIELIYEKVPSEKINI